MPKTAQDHDSWLKLGLLPGIGDGAMRRLLDIFGTPDVALTANRGQLTPHLSAKQIDTLQAGPDTELLEQTLGWLSAPGHHLITLLDEDYPPLLRETADPPALLYGSGRRELLMQSCLAIVGSRNATPQGEANAEAFGLSLSSVGITIVSGLALGIDAAAHKGGIGFIPRGTRRWRMKSLKRACCCPNLPWARFPRRAIFPGATGSFQGFHAAYWWWKLHSIPAR
jgi:DNA processing protein